MADAFGCVKSVITTGEVTKKGDKKSGKVKTFYIRDGDIADKVNSFHTVIILLMCSIFTATWEFVGKPLRCWYPPQFVKWWYEYGNEYCYVQGTYFLTETGARKVLNNSNDNMWAQQGRFSVNLNDRHDKVLPYYQWVPVFLVLQAMAFYAPAVVWKLISSHGSFIKPILEKTSKSSNMAPAQLQRDVNIIAKYMESYCNVTSHPSLDPGFGSFMAGRFFVTMYLLVKLLYCINVVSQFFILNAFLGFEMESFWWGHSILYGLINGKEWMESGRFPRVTWCDFHVRALGNVHRYTVQCVLLINMFNEKFFVFLWFWFLVVTIITLSSLLHWLYVTLAPRMSETFIADLLKREPNAKMATAAQLQQFIRQRLREDGVFLLRLLGVIGAGHIARRVARHLWTNFNREAAADALNDPCATSKVRLSLPTIDEMSSIATIEDELGRCTHGEVGVPDYGPYGSRLRPLPRDIRDVEDGVATTRL